jgi:iron complex outermembrane receptor protein
MKKLIPFVLFLIIFHSFHAIASIKGSFSGIVKDSKTGRPIEGASIYISDLKAGSSSNSNGEFYIVNVSDGKHLVEVSHLGYATIAFNVEVYGDTKKDFFLTESII